MNVGKRIRNLRTGLHLSQDYMANQLGIDRKDYTQIESGKREITSDEIAKLSEMFGVSENTIVNGAPSIPVKIRGFENLNEHDRNEVMNLLIFREQLRTRA